MKKILKLSFLLFCFSCNDMWRDKEIKIDGNIYVIYSAGDGFRLGRKVGNSSYDVGILKSTVSEIYKKERLLIIKSAPESNAKDTEYYKINYNKLYDSLSVHQISLKEYDSLRSKLKDILPR